MEAVVIITEAPRGSGDMAMDTMEREMLSQDMAMQLPTPMVMTLPTDTARDQLRLRLNQVMDMLPATLTDLHRVSLLDMEVTDMEDMVVTMAREMLSQVMVMLLLLTIHMEDPALSTEALKV